jgi:hypothetical protein
MFETLVLKNGKLLQSVEYKKHFRFIPLKKEKTEQQQQKKEKKKRKRTVKNKQ